MRYTTLTGVEGADPTKSSSCLRQQNLLEELPGKAFLHPGDLLGGALGNHVAARIAAFGAQIDQPVGGLNHVEVVLDDNHRVSGVGQAVQHVQQVLDVGEMQPGGGLVEDVDRVTGGDTRQFFGQFYPLGFAAREGSGALPQFDIAQPDL